MKQNYKIKVELKKEEIEAWIFEVFVVSDLETYTFLVILDKVYYKELTDKKILPSVLVQQSFFFLLQKEPVSSILKEFNLQEITNYFKDFEDEIYRITHTHER